MFMFKDLLFAHARSFFSFVCSFLFFVLSLCVACMIVHKIHFSPAEIL